MNFIRCLFLAMINKITMAPAWAQISDINVAINKAGRQRMLSQRMAKFYQGIAWGVGDANSSAELEKARKDFTAAHQELAAAPANTPAIKDGLALVLLLLFFFDIALNKKETGDNRKQLTTNVATTSERILEEMESIVGLYERVTAK